MGRYWAESGPMGPAQLAQWAKSQRFLPRLDPTVKTRHSGPLSGSAEQRRAIAHTGNQPMKSYEKSRFGPWAILGFDGHPRPCGAAHHLFDDMSAPSRGGDTPLHRHRGRCGRHDEARHPTVNLQRSSTGRSPAHRQETPRAATASSGA
jgi:hypothetical protein